MSGGWGGGSIRRQRDHLESSAVIETSQRGLAMMSQSLEEKAVVGKGVRVEMLDCSERRHEEQGGKRWQKFWGMFL